MYIVYECSSSILEMQKVSERGMVKRKKRKAQAAEPTESVEQVTSDVDAVVEATEQEPSTGESALEGVISQEAPVDTYAEELTRLAEEVEMQKERYLRLAAEFDNYRKRMLREREQTRSVAQGDVVATVIESLDDLARVAHLDPAQTNAQDVIAGVELVERKLLRELKNAGLVPIGTEGDRFNPHDHEAVATAPALEANQEDHIAAVLQVGYRFGKMLLRPARVQVFVATETDEVSDA
jgi:molecular chaperone GrpE